MEGAAIFILLIASVSVIFWIWSLVDCLKSEWKKPNDKTVWLLVILFLNLLGSLLYFLIAKDKQVKKGESVEQIKSEGGINETK